MVAENLGSIPPNTSVMIITTASKRYEVFISSDEQNNAKVVFELKKWTWKIRTPKLRGESRSLRNIGQDFLQ